MIAKRIVRILVGVLNAWLVASLIGGAALAIPNMATDFGTSVGHPFTISNQSTQELDPAVAYNSQRQEYLVVFWNDRPGNDDIRAERVSKDGKLLGGVWVAAGAGTERRYPDVAYNTTSNEYLVVWEEDEIDIRGQRISATGGLTGGAFDIALGVPSYPRCYTPAVAYASTENKYLVVFQHYSPTTGYSIVAQALKSDGSAWGTGFEIEPLTTSLKWYPDLTYNRLRNEFLVVWGQYNPSQYDIRGRRVKMSGGAGTLGSAFWFSCDPSRDDFLPVVAAVPRPPDGQYLVAWQYWSNANNYDIWAQRVSGGGTLEGSAFLVYASAQSDLRSAVAGNESNQQYLVAWTTPVPPPVSFTNIYVRVVPTSGSLVGPVTWVRGNYADNAAVAAGPVGDFLIAFQDTPVSGGLDIYGQLWGIRLYLPLVVRQ
jgi:hypothetical protein